MSEIVYTELEGFPVCWPYNQTRPFSNPQKLNEQNISGSASTTEENVGLMEGDTDVDDAPIYGENWVQKFILPPKRYKVTKAVVRVKKVGSPPDNLYVSVQDGGWLLQGYIDSYAGGGTSVSQPLYGARRYVFRVRARFKGSRITVTGRIQIVGSPPPLVVELRDSSDGSIMGSLLLGTIVSPPTYGGTTLSFVASFQADAEKDKYYSFVFYVQNDGGDASNYYSFLTRNTTDRICGDVAAYYFDGSSWASSYPLFMAVASWRDPSTVVTASISAASVSTSYSNITVTLPSPIYAAPFIVIRVYSPNSNSSNYYVLPKRIYLTKAPDEAAFYASGGAIPHGGPRCLMTQGIGLEMVKLFEKNITLVKRIPAASPQPKINVTFSGATIIGIFALGENTYITESSSSGTFFNKVLSPGTLSMELYVCNGSTTITDITYLEQVYFDKNPVTPRDFGFSELYLLRVDLPAGGQIRMNDHAAGDLYSSSATTITFADFRIPVRKIEVINGAPTLWFIGVI